MAKVTSKLQVTVPKVLAAEYDIKPGDEIVWQSAGDSIRVLPQGHRPPGRSVTERLRLFDQATERERARQAGVAPTDGSRGWTREELYDRGRSR